MPAKLTRTHGVAALFLIMTLGLLLRVRGLDRVGFNENEVSKVVAARAYLRGKFCVELEHPMLMKSLIAVSLAAADSWIAELKNESCGESCGLMRAAVSGSWVLTAMMGAGVGLEQLGEPGMGVKGQRNSVVARSAGKCFGGRDDLRYFDLSDQGKTVEDPPSTYVIVQKETKYIENIAFLQRVESSEAPIETLEIAGALAARIYRMEPIGELEND